MKTESIDEFSNHPVLWFFPHWWTPCDICKWIDAHDSGINDGKHCGLVSMARQVWPLRYFVTLEFTRWLTRFALLFLCFSAFSQVPVFIPGESGHSYVIQSNSLPNGRYWRDVFAWCGNGVGFSLPMPTDQSQGFYRVLDLPYNAFWYNWNWHQPSDLVAFGLGTPGAYIHVDKPYDWYLQQYLSGPNSQINCMPTCGTMVRQWRTNLIADAYDEIAAASAARNTAQQGGWTTGDLESYWDTNGVPWSYISINPNDCCIKGGTPASLTNALTQGNLLVVCINMGYISTDPVPEHRKGRFWYGSSLHAIVLKGWRVFDGVVYFEVFDPAPCCYWQDGECNTKNRYYAYDDVVQSMLHDFWYAYCVPPSGVQPMAKSSFRAPPSLPR